MTTRLVLAAALSLIFSSQPTTPASSADGPPAWAYPMTPPDFKLPPDDGKLHHVPDSSAAFTTTQLRDRFFAKDWHPDDHPRCPALSRMAGNPMRLPAATVIGQMEVGVLKTQALPGSLRLTSRSRWPISEVEQEGVQFPDGSQWR
jgi:hypothetical protein